MLGWRRSIDSNLVLDIGSGSVGAALTVAGNEEPNLIWQKRRHLHPTHIDPLAATKKALVSLLVDISNDISCAGIPALTTTLNNKTAIKNIAVTVAAPWSHTVIRPIDYQDSNSFTVSPDFCYQLNLSSATEIRDQLMKKHKVLYGGYDETSYATVALQADGHNLQSIDGQTAKQIKLTQAVTFVNSAFINMLLELRDALCPAATLKLTSSMLALHHGAEQISTTSTDYGCIDITDEATEISFTVAGAPHYASHITSGRATLARDIARIEKRPLTEVMLRLGDILRTDGRRKYAMFLDSYMEQCLTMLASSKEPAHWPSKYYLQCDPDLATSLSTVFEAAITQTCQCSSEVTGLAGALGLSPGQDVGLHSAAAFFHNHDKQMRFVYV